MCSANEDAKMKFGFNEADYELFQRLVVAPLSALGTELYVFGSRSTGKNHPFSDLDLLIVPPKDHASIAKHLLAVKEAIEESRFPVKIDFVLMDDLASAYRATVLKERVRI